MLLRTRRTDGQWRGKVHPSMQVAALTCVVLGSRPRQAAFPAAAASNDNSWTNPFEQQQKHVPAPVPVSNAAAAVAAVGAAASVPVAVADIEAVLHVVRAGDVTRVHPGVRRRRRRRRHAHRHLDHRARRCWLFDHRDCHRAETPLLPRSRLAPRQQRCSPTRPPVPHPLPAAQSQPTCCRRRRRRHCCCCCCCCCCCGCCLQYKDSSCSCSCSPRLASLSKLSTSAEPSTVYLSTVPLLAEVPVVISERPKAGAERPSLDRPAHELETQPRISQNDHWAFRYQYSLRLNSVTLFSVDRHIPQL